MSNTIDEQVNAIKAAAACSFDVYYWDMISKRKRKPEVVARQVAMYVIRKKLKLSYPKIARYFSKKDHTTVMHAESKIEFIRHQNNRITQFLLSWGV